MYLVFPLASWAFLSAFLADTQVKLDYLAWPVPLPQLTSTRYPAPFDLVASPGSELVSTAIKSLTDASLCPDGKVVQTSSWHKINIYYGIQRPPHLYSHCYWAHPLVSVTAGVLREGVGESVGGVQDVWAVAIRNVDFIVFILRIIHFLLSLSIPVTLR